MDLNRVEHIIQITHVQCTCVITSLPIDVPPVVVFFCSSSEKIIIDEFFQLRQHKLSSYIGSLVNKIL